MRFKQIIFGTLAASTLLLAAYCPKPEPAQRDAVLLQAVMNGLTQLHFSPQKLNDDFSKKVYKLHLDRLDGGRRFLTQQDVAAFQSFENQIDDEANAGTFQFFEASQNAYDLGVKKAEGFMKEALTQKFDFSTKEDIEFGENKPFAKDDAALKENWRKQIKYDVLSRYANKLDEKEKKDDRVVDATGNTVVKETQSDLKNKTNEELLADAVKETTKTYTDYFKRLGKVKRNEKLANFLNAIANVYDPHTEYFEPEDKKDFDVSMSGRLIGIGARLQSDPDGDYTKVNEIVVGGPAWKQKELKEGDVILKVAQGDKEPIDIAGMEIKEVVSMIRGKENTEVRLTVKSKADGTIKVVTIQREEVIMEDTYAKSLVMQATEKDDKIGYIRLTKFYADFEKEDGHQCAEDVAIEVEKLKKAGVKGIIIDLRNNGGGSLRDVVKMTGLFIEDGPIVQVKGRDMRPDVQEDDDNRVQYDGNLIIMVNEYSASASEIMAAALQDYGRAVIVGSDTYGKGTVQRFYDLDRSLRGNEDIKPLGQVKVTIQKFFRINGGSTQLKGVKPDIVLPDNLSEVKAGEEENDYPLAWTSIQPTTYEQKVNNISKKLPKWVAKSNERLAKNEAFKQIGENAKRIKIQKDKTTYPLNLTEYRTYEKQQKDWTKKYDDLFKVNAAMKVENMPADFKAIEADKGKVARNEEWIKDLKKDVYLAETLNIMRDMNK